MNFNHKQLIADNPYQTSIYVSISVGPVLVDDAVELRRKDEAILLDDVEEQVTRMARELVSRLRRMATVGT